MNFADFYMTWKYNALILLNKKHALGRSLVIFKNSVSRSKSGGHTLQGW
ncbi:preprotein translocase subunit SecY [Escherichia coli]|nr:preprotein translocase subunit SecY [Escherichia coli]